MEYKVINAVNKDKFEDLVARAIAEGWKPLGGVVFGNYNFMQAMIREK